MPYIIKEILNKNGHSSGWFKVYNKDTGLAMSVKAKHYPDALAHLRALEINVKDAKSKKPRAKKAKGGFLKPVKPPLGASKEAIDQYNKDLGDYNQEERAKRGQEKGYTAVDAKAENEKNYLQHQAEWVPKNEERLKEKRDAFFKARDDYDEAHGRSGFRTLNNALIKVADVAVKAPFVPSIVKDVYENFGPKAMGYDTGEGLKPQNNVFLEASKGAYEKSGVQINGYSIIRKTPTLTFYKKDNDNTIVIAVRGTQDKGDMWADVSLAFNALGRTKRYKDDEKVVREVLNAYPNYDVYITGHSLGGAVADRLMKDFPRIHSGVTYNPAYETSSFFKKNNNERIYNEEDPLGKLGRYLPTATVQKKQEPNSLVSKIPYVSNLFAHKLDNIVPDAVPEVNVQPVVPIATAPDNAKNVDGGRLKQKVSNARRSFLSKLDKI